MRFNLILTTAVLGALISINSCSSNVGNASHSTKLNVPEENRMVGEKHNQGMEYLFQSLRTYYLSESSDKAAIPMTPSELEDFANTKIHEFMLSQHLLNDGNQTHAYMQAKQNAEDIPAELEAYYQEIRNVLSIEPINQYTLAYDLNRINTKAQNEFQYAVDYENTVYSGTSTTLSSYIYWKENHRKWLIALNFPEMLDIYTDEELNDISLWENGYITPINMTKGWIQDIWHDLKIIVKDWWNNGGEELVVADGTGAMGGAIGATLLGPGGVAAGAVGGGVAGSLQEAYNQWSKTTNKEQ